MTDPDRAIQWHGRRWDDRLESARASVPAGEAEAAAGGSAEEAAWRTVVDPDDAGLFARRLAWDGLDETCVELLFRPGAGPHGTHAAWWDELVHLRAACRQAAAGPADDLAWLEGLEAGMNEAPSSAPPGEPIPFAHLLWPLVRRSWDQLAASLDREIVRPRAAQARDDVRGALLERLSRVCVRALIEDFIRDRPFGRGLMLALAGGPAAAGARRDRYASWCRANLRDGLSRLLGEYPVLGRIVAVICLQWRRNLAELLRRVHADRGALRATFGIGDDAGLARLRWGLSDPHRGGRSVATLSFAGDVLDITIVYKPKDVRMEARFQGLIGEVAAALGDASFVSPAVLPRGGEYGYASYVPHTPCSAAAELPAFYRNAGRLLAVLHLLGATDCHSGNLIACGTGLVLVDAETLFEGRLRALGSEAPAAGEGPLEGPLAISLLQTVMLPTWLQGGAEGAFYDISALGADPAPAEARPAPGWRNVNSDDMVWATRPVVPDHPASLPVAPGSANPLADHVEALIEGFAEVYTLAMAPALRARIVRHIRGFAGARRRVLLRHTRTYAIVQHRALAPQALRSAAARARELERLSRAYVLSDDKPLLWPLLRAELHDMEDLDVPYFDHGLGATAIHAAGAAIPDALDGDGLTEAVERVRSLSAGDLAWQVRLIRAAIGVRGYRMTPSPAVGAGATAEAEGEAPPTGGERALSADERLAACRDIYQALAGSALSDGAGDPTWLTPSVLPAVLSDPRRVALWLITDGLYDGRAGVAAFLYAWAACDPGGPAAALAAATIAPVLRALDDRDGYARFRFLRDLGLGMNGVGGLLRLFEMLARTSSASACDSNEYRDRLAELVNDELIGKDRALDLLSGAAGAVGPLARLHAQRPSDQSARALAGLGRRLLSAQDAATGGWFTGQCVRPLTGLSHGAAGMGLALLEAGVALGDERLVEAAARAFAYEASVFDSAAGNWP
ncbi:MAG: type 2 lanthipeptide synthetase LanM, partial [Actinomycetes bacterium]